MRKILSLFVVCCMAIAMQAKVAYLVPATSINRDAIPAEDNGQDPERNAYDWFKTNYVDTEKGIFMSLNDLSSIPTDVDVIWVNVDRVGLSLEAFDGEEYFNATRVGYLSDFVKAGGNLFLTKQATRLVHRIGRCTWAPSYKSEGYHNANDQWDVCFDFCTGTSHYGHRFYNDLTDLSAQDDLDHNTRFRLTAGDHSDYRRTDNNCVWGSWGDYGIEDDGCSPERARKFEEGQNCAVLGGWGHTRGMDCAGWVEFYPQGDYKGTVVAMGLAAFQWGKDNIAVNNVKTITANTFSYLSKPVVTWNNEPVDGAVFTIQDTATVGSETQGLAITHTTSNGDVAYIFDGHKIQRQGIGECDIIVTYAGDGFANSSKTAYTMTKHIAVTPFYNENAQIAYVLTANSLNNLDSQDAKEAENQDPMYQSALWFYNTYCTNPEYMIGSIIPADEISETSAQVIWLDIDRNFADETALKDYLAPLKEPIANAVKAGKNVYLSKFAVALVSEMGRYATLPQTIGYGKSYEVNAVWSMGRHSDYKFKHAIFREFSTESHPITLMSGTNCTDRNCVWNDHEFDAVADAVDLGGWYNGDDQGSCAGLVEFYPTGDWKGTIIANGVAAYQWGRCNQTSLDGEPWATFNTRRLTDNIFLYLKQYEADGFVWDIAPENGPLGSTQKVTIEHKDYGDCKAIQWTSLDESKATVEPATDNCENAVLTLLAPGEVTITATRVGDGILKPLNVTPRFVTKTITIDEQYTRVVTNGNYGTICLPYAAASFTGAEMYSIAGKMEGDEGVYIDQVTTMEAGVPYIYLATNNQLSVTYATGEAQEAQTKNGLVGYINVNDEVIPVGEDNYIIYNDLLYLVDSEVKIATNHAYIHWSDVPAKPAAAPAIKRVAMPMHNTPTTIMNTKSNVRITKAIKDGQIVIVRDNKMYNVLGQDY